MRDISTPRMTGCVLVVGPATVLQTSSNRLWVHPVSCLVPSYPRISLSNDSNICLDMEMSTSCMIIMVIYHVCSNKWLRILCPRPHMGGWGIGI